MRREGDCLLCKDDDIDPQDKKDGILWSAASKLFDKLPKMRTKSIFFLRIKPFTAEAQVYVVPYSDIYIYLYQYVTLLSKSVSSSRRNPRH